MNLVEMGFSSLMVAGAVLLGLVGVFTAMALF